MADDAVIPGMTKQAENVLRLVLREEIAAGIKDAFSDAACPRSCERVEALSIAVFGRTEKNIVGMDDRLRAMERALGNAARAFWIAVSALIVSLIGTLVGIAIKS